MTVLTRVRVWNDVKMVTLQGDLVALPAESELLHGGTDNLTHAVCAVRLDDGREVLVAREHLEVMR